MELADALVEWLLASPEPGIRRLVRRDLLAQPASDDDADVLDGPAVAALLEGQQPDGGFGGHPYKKWGGAHWRLVSLVELGIPRGEPRAIAAYETVLPWIGGTSHVRNVPIIRGLARRCGSQEGNALAVGARLGLADDPRVAQLAASLVDWQWPDGGWNCDRSPQAHRSSFHESLAPVWGLHEFAAATGDTHAAAAARRGAELFLEHRIFRSLKDGEPINAEWMTLHWPPYWHYDVLQALVVLQRMGLTDDPRNADALQLVRDRRRADGRWVASARWWKPPGSKGGGIEAIDWAVDEAGDRMVTVRALTALGGD